MRNKRLVAVVISMVMLGTIAFLATLALADDRPSPASIGAYFVPDYASIQPAEFNPSVSEQIARDAAFEFFMDGFDLPRGVGVKEGIVTRSTTGSFSGAKRGSGDWTIYDRPVWVVVLDEVPISLPCGPHGGNCPEHRPQYNVVIDAETGEILSSQMTGAGSRHPKWANIQLAGPGDPPEPTPAP